MSKTSLVILAAGFGSRFGGTKQIEPIDEEGNALIDYSIYNAIAAGFEKIVFIVRDEILAEFEHGFRPKLEEKSIDVEFVVQDVESIPEEFLPMDRVKPWGTGHALLAAWEVVTENFCVINADDFYGRSSYLDLQKHLKTIDSTSTDFAMVGYPIKRTLSANGTVSRGVCDVDAEGFLRGVEERTKIYEENQEIRYSHHGAVSTLDPNSLVSMNMWGFTPQIFKYLKEHFRAFLRLNSSDASAEFYLPTTVNDLISQGEASVRVVESDSEWMGLTYREDMARVIARLAELKAEGIHPGQLWS